MAVFGGIGVFTQAGLVRNPVNPAVGSPFGVLPATPSISSLVLGPTIIRSAGPFTYDDAISFGATTGLSPTGVFSAAPTASLTTATGIAGAGGFTYTSSASAINFSPSVAVLKNTLAPIFLFDATVARRLPAQLMLVRSSGGTYFDVNGVMKTAANNMPRFDYKYNGTSWVPAGLLIEEQRYNNASTNDFTSWNNVNSATTVASGATGLDGTSSAYTLTPNNNATSRLVYNNAGAFVTSVTTAMSVYVKPNGYTQFAMRECATTGAAAVFTLTGSGSVFTTYNAGGVTVLNAAIDNIGGGWYRVKALMTPSGSTSLSMGITCLDGSYASGDPFSYSYTANGTSGAIVCFPQLEPTANSVSSYIATAGSGVFRQPDILSSTDPTLLASKARIMEVGELQPSTQATLFGFNTAIGLGVTSGNAVQTANGGTQTTGNTATWSGVNRAGIAFDSTPRVSIDLNGGTVVTAANTPVTLTNIYYGNTNNGASDFLNGHIRLIAAYVKATDTQLATISASGASPYITVTGDTLYSGSTLATLTTSFSVDWTSSSSIPASLTFSRASSGTYFNSSGVMQTATANTARYDYKYNGVTWIPAGLLIEEQRTNYTTTNDVTTWTIPNAATTVTSGATGVDGTSSAYTITPNNASTTSRGMYNAAGNFNATAPVTMSIYVKPNGYTQFAIRESASTASSAVFDLTGSGSVLYTWNNGGMTVTNAAVDNVGSGWYRVRALFTYSGTMTIGIVSLDGSYSGGADPFLTSFTANGTSGAIVCFPQMEMGASASSYILTSSGTVTRSADILSSTDATLLAAKGWVVEVGEANPFTQSALLGVNTIMALGASSDLTLRTADGGTQVTDNIGTWSDINRGGIAWDSTPRVSIDLNGGTVVTAANTPVTPTNLYFGNVNNGASDYLNGHIKKMASYAAVTDADLQVISNAGAPFTVTAPSGSSYSNTSTINTSPALAAATFAALVGAGSGGVASGISPGSNINALNSTSVTTATAISPAGNFIATALATLAETSGISTAGGLNLTNTVSLTFTSGISDLAKLNLTGLATLAVTAVIAAASADVMTSTATLTTATGIAPTGNLLMNASSSIAVHPAMSSTGGADYLQSITLAATQAIASSVKLTVSGTAALSATITELVQSTALMAAVSSVATQAGVSAAGALNINTTAALTSSPHVGITGGLSLNGAIGFNSSVASNSSVQYKLNPQLSFQAAYNSSASNALSSSDEIELAAQLFVLSLLESDHPLATLLYAKGVWQDTLSLKGILDSLKEIKGVVN